MWTASARLALRGLARPWALVALALGAGLPLAWEGLYELGISTHDLDSTALYYEVAFIGALLGGALGLSLAEEWSWCSARLQPREVLLHEGLLLALPALILAGAPLLRCLAGGWATSPALGGALLLALARPVVVGLALRRLPLPPLARVLGLLALCWWIPAIFAPSFLGGPDLAAHPAAGPARTATHATSGPWVAETTLLLALLLAARLGLGGATRRT